MKKNHFILSKIAYWSQIELRLFNFTDFLRCWLPDVSFWLSLSPSLSLALSSSLFYSIRIFTIRFKSTTTNVFIYFALLPTPKGHCTNNIKHVRISHIHKNYDLIWNKNQKMSNNHYIEPFIVWSCTAII